MFERRYKQLLDAVDRIHRAALAPENWPEALEAIALCTGSAPACMYTIDRSNGAVQDLLTANMDPDAGVDYAAYYYQLDPWLVGIPGSLAAHRPIRGTRIITDHGLRATEFYNDFVRHLDMRFPLTGFSRRSPTHLDVVSVFRGTKQTDFEDEIMDSYSILLEEVGEAIEMQRTMGRLQQRAEGLAAALEQVPVAVVLLDQSARVVHVNSNAERVLRAADGLSLQQDRLEIAAPEARRSLERLLARRSRVASSGKKRTPSLISIPRVSGERAYTARIFPLSPSLDLADSGDIPGAPILLMTIADPRERRTRVSPDELKAVYDLTPGEATVAAALAEGASVKNVAERQKIAEDTVRKHLRSVFEKTETHRQAELVQRLLSELGI